MMDFYHALAASPYGNVYIVAFAELREKAEALIDNCVRAAASDYAQKPIREGDRWTVRSSIGDNRIPVCWIAPIEDTRGWGSLFANECDFDVVTCALLMQLGVRFS